MRRTRSSAGSASSTTKPSSFILACQPGGTRMVDSSDSMTAGPGATKPGGHAPAIVDRGVDCARLPEPHLARDLTASVPAGAGLSRMSSGGMAPMAVDAGADELHRLAAVVVAVGLAVTVVKRSAISSSAAGIQRARRNGHRQLVGLALVARIDASARSAAAPARRRRGRAWRRPASPAQRTRPPARQDRRSRSWCRRCARSRA